MLILKSYKSNQEAKEMHYQEELREKNQKTSTNLSSYALAVVAIVVCFIGFNYLKLQNQINSSFFGLGKNFKIERSGIDKIDSQASNNAPPIDLIKESRATK